jgi:hypothetical protein
MLELAPAKSESMEDHVIPMNTVQEFYERYKIETEQKGIYPVRSLTFFNKWLHFLKIKTPPFNKYTCPICNSEDKVCNCELI